MKKLFIGMPIYKGSPAPECLKSIYEKIFIENKSYTIEPKHFAIFRGSPNIYMQRYNLAMEFLKTDCDYFLYMDGDQVFHDPKKPIELLMLDDVDIISPLIVRRLFPHLPTCKTIERVQANIHQEILLEDFRDYPQYKPYMVYYCCGGVVLIKREVIEAVDKPFYPVIDGNGNLMGTDYSFFHKAIEKKFTCWIEPRLQVSHIGKYEYLPGDYYGILDSGKLKVKIVNGEYQYLMEP